MSVASYIADDLFVVRIVKSLIANPANKWANTYELRAIIPGSADELLEAALKIQAFEKSIHYAVTRFDGLTISTWDPDSVPYNPNAFISTALSDFGTRTTTGNATPLSTCLSVARVPPTGRLGHLFYRGMLVEADVEAPAGKSILSNPIAINGELEPAIAFSGFQDLIGVGATSLQLVMVDKTAANIRPVVGLVAVGVTQLPTDHAWFNRTIPAP